MCVCARACAHGMEMNKHIVVSISMRVTFDVVAEYKQFLEARLRHCSVSWENKNAQIEII